jgi:ABC-type polysaccharide/polyol phosphate export permease
LHQVVIIVAVFVIFQLAVGFYGLVSLIGLALLIGNGIWLTFVFRIVGARYRDLSEVVQAVMRIAFLATPIIWMPAQEGRGDVLGAFLTCNPFYHFLELIRAPLLGNPIAPLSWLVVLFTTVAGFFLAHV